MRVYAEQLEKAVREHPQEYAYPVDQVPTVVQRMRGAIQENRFNKDSTAFRQTCKVLKIKHTYKAIEQFIANHA